jgi:hypothetical protein
MKMVECIQCHVQFEEIKLVIYYANGKPVFSKHCVACIAKRWNEIKDKLNE